MIGFANVLVFFLTIFFTFQAQAEILASDLPSMGNLAALIGKADQNKVEESVFDKHGKISSNLPALDSARGQTATEIATLLSGGSEETKVILQEAILAERADFEKTLTEANFKTDDMGVAYAACFIVLWELASNNELPVEAALAAGKFLVHSFSGIEQQYTSLDETEKAKAYDWLMTTAVAFASLVKGFEKQGKTSEAKLLRQKSATLFADTFKLPYDLVTISAKGDFGVNVEKVKSYQEKNALSSDW